MPVNDKSEDPGDRRSGRRKRREGRGAQARRAARQSRTLVSLPVLESKLLPTELLSAEGLELIEDNAERLMAEIGLDWKDDPEALQLWREAGADVEGERVRMPKGLARSLIKTAPSSFVQRARNPARSVKIGGKARIFAPVYGPPFVRDLSGERRYAQLEDFRNFARLVYMLPALHHAGGTLCEPVDVPVPKRHLDMLMAHITLSDKPFMGSVTAPERAEDSVEMVKILFGQSFNDAPSLISLINVNSPLVYDATMVGALKAYARAGQATIISPFIIAGAMSPTTVAGTITQALAEALSGLAFSQLLNPGAPVVLGTFAASMSMQSGAPTFGTPEPALVLLAMGQFARRYNLPFRSGGGLCASKLPDAQAAYESLATINSAMMGGVNFMLHAAGWLEGGLVSSYEKLLLDADQLHMQQIFHSEPDLSEEGLAFSAFEEGGPGKHFLGAAHTQAHFQTAFYRSPLADSNSYEQWDSEGGLDAAARANSEAKKMLADYQPPELDPGIKEELEDFIARRKAELPDQAF